MGKQSIQICRCQSVRGSCSLLSSALSNIHFSIATKTSMFEHVWTMWSIGMCFCSWKPDRKPKINNSVDFFFCFFFTYSIFERQIERCSESISIDNNRWNGVKSNIHTNAPRNGNEQQNKIENKKNQTRNSFKS